MISNRKVHSVFSTPTVFAFLLVFLPRISVCWNFTSVNLPEEIFIRKFAVWRNRAFLAIPRWKLEKKDKDKSATVYETIWPESNFPIAPSTKIFSAIIDEKPVNDECFRSTVDLSADARGRLWILEVPHSNVDSNCSARIVVYDLRRNDQLITSIELTDVVTKDLRALAVDYWGSRAYVGDPGDESIITFCMAKRRWWKIKLIRESKCPRIYSTNLAISRKNSVLYLTGSNSLDLFSVSLEDSWHQKGSVISKNLEKTVNITVSWLGTKMGTSSGLFCDIAGGLHYFMTSEKASVRWDTRFPLKAESHSILLQDERYPCISDYITDAQKNIWGLVNTECQFAESDITARIPLKSRTVRIGKYSFA